jgi:DNA primase
MSVDPAGRIDTSALRSAVSLSSLIAPTVKLKRATNAWVGLCPFHNEKTASFYVYDDTQHFHCFGCGAHGDALTWIERNERIGFKDAAKRLTEYAGSAGDFERRFIARAEAYAADPIGATLSKDELERMTRARSLWEAAGPTKGTMAEVYLASRGLSGAHQALRYLPEPSTLLAAVTDTRGALRAVQRILLTVDGGNVKREGKSLRLTLGPMGAGAVKFGTIGSTLGIAESVEKAIAARQLFALPVWASLGAARLGKIALPKEVRQVVIFADGDDTGRREADSAAFAYEATGRAVQTMLPPGGKKDWDDITREG